MEDDERRREQTRERVRRFRERRDVTRNAERVTRNADVTRAANALIAAVDALQDARNAEIAGALKVLVTAFLTRVTGELTSMPPSAAAASQTTPPGNETEDDEPFEGPTDAGRAIIREIRDRLNGRVDTPTTRRTQ